MRKLTYIRLKLLDVKLNQQVLVNYAKRNKQSHLIVFSVTVLVSLEEYIKLLQKYHKVIQCIHWKPCCYCLFITVLFFMHRELVKELTLEVQNQQQQKAVKTVRTLGSEDSRCDWKSLPFKAI